MELLIFIIAVTALIATTINALITPKKTSKETESVSEKSEMRLTMKSIIRWEQLNKKPFSQIDYGNENDILSLFYVCRQAADIQTSFDEFKTVLTDESIKEMLAAFERQISLASQFQAKAKKKANADDEATGDSDVYIKDVVPILVMNGLDAHFAMNDMELYDLPIFLKAYDTKVKEQLTAQRLWAFIQVSPHLKPGQTPKDIHPFAWEMEADSLSEEKLAEANSEFKLFMESGLTT